MKITVQILLNRKRFIKLYKSNLIPRLINRITNKYLIYWFKRTVHKLKYNKTRFDFSAQYVIVKDHCKINLLKFLGSLLQIMEVSGIEPPTSCLQGRRSPELSYTPDLITNWTNSIMRIKN